VVALWGGLGPPRLHAHAYARVHTRALARSRPGSKRLTASPSCPRSPLLPPPSDLSPTLRTENAPPKGPPRAQLPMTFPRGYPRGSRVFDVAPMISLSRCSSPHRTTLFFFRRASRHPPTTPPGAVEFHNRESRRAALEMECVTATLRQFTAIDNRWKDFRETSSSRGERRARKHSRVGSPRARRGRIRTNLFFTSSSSSLEVVVRVCPSLLRYIHAIYP